MTIQTVKIPAPNLPLSDTNRALRESPLIAEIRARLTRQDQAFAVLEEIRTSLSVTKKALREARATVRKMERAPIDPVAYAEAKAEVQSLEVRAHREAECEGEDANTLRLRTASAARAARDLIYAIDAGTI